MYIQGITDPNKKTLKTDQGITNLHNLSSPELEEAFYFIHLNSRWLLELLNRLKIGFYIFFDFRYIAYNNQFAEIIQYDPYDLDHLKVGDVVFERERKMLRHEIKELQEAQTGAFDSRLTIIKGNKELGSVQYFSFITSIEKYPVGVAYVLDEKDHDLTNKTQMKINYSIIVELQDKVEQMLHLNQHVSMMESTGLNYREDLHSEYDLTRREQEVLQYIYKGYSNAQIAHTLFISKRTVEFHRSNLMEKTGTKNGVELLYFALKTRLIDQVS